jgi:hypothetical protein
MNILGRVVPWVVGVAAAGLLLLHTLQWRAITVDTTTLALLGLIAIVPFLEYVRKIKIGGFEAEIDPHEVKRVQEQAADALIESPPTAEIKPFKAQVLELVRRDPQLGLAKIRIEVERVLRLMYDRIAPKTHQRRHLTIPRMVEVVQHHELVSSEIAAALREVTTLANRAVHGEHISMEDALSVAEVGADLIEQLQMAYTERILMPISSEIITIEELENFTTAKYKVVSVTPYVHNPKKETRILSQSNLGEMLEGYNEYAEFLVAIEKLDE